MPYAWVRVLSRHSTTGGAVNLKTSVTEAHCYEPDFLFPRTTLQLHLPQPQGVADDGD